MTQDVTDDGVMLCTDGQAFVPSRWDCETVAAYRNFSWPTDSWGNMIKQLMLAGFCFTLMTGCSLTYKGPAYDLSTVAGLRPQSVEYREANAMLNQQRHRLGRLLR